MHETSSEHAAGASAHEAALRLVPASLAARVFAGAPFAAAWTAAVAAPLVRSVESDVPTGLAVGAMTIATITPAMLYLRRHAAETRLRWDDHTVTLLRGGRVVTSVAWADATLRARSFVRAPGAFRVVEIADDTGRRITLTTGATADTYTPGGRVRIDDADLDALRAVARAGGASEQTNVRPRSIDVELAVPFVGVPVALCVALTAAAPGVDHGALAALGFAAACALLLGDPIRRLCAALARPPGREMLLIDTEERGRLRAQRLDGSRVLLDVTAAHHPDARLAARRGFVNAVLATPDGGTGTYREMETPIAATFVETRDDRVLRFEHLRAALVDVIGYGAFLATGIAAALVT